MIQRSKGHSTTLSNGATLGDWEMVFCYLHEWNTKYRTAVFGIFGILTCSRMMYLYNGPGRGTLPPSTCIPRPYSSSFRLMTAPAVSYSLTFFFVSSGVFSGADGFSLHRFSSAVLVLPDRKFIRAALVRLFSIKMYVVSRIYLV